MGVENESNKSPSIDSILRSLGSMGRYQITQALLVDISLLTVGFHLFSFVFVAQPVEHHCSEHTEYSMDASSFHNLTQNASGYAKCSREGGECSAWAYPVRKEHSIVSEWSLVCNDEFFARLPQSLFIVGQGIGAVTFSAFSDKFGRKTSLVTAHILTACFGVSLSFAPNIAAFSVLRLMNGICQQGIVVTCVTLLLETFPANRRVFMASVYYVIWSLSTMLLTMAAYLLRDLTWRMQQLAFTGVSVILILQIFFLGESLRWLITNKKYKRALKIIDTATKLNKIESETIAYTCNELKIADTPEKEEPIKTIHETAPSVEDSKTYSVRAVVGGSQYSFFDLCKVTFLLKMSAIVWFSWLVDSLTYFSLYLTASSLADDLYLNFLLNSLAELPSGPMYWFVGRRWGRRRYFIVFHLVAGIGLLSATGVRAFSDTQSASIAATILAFIGKVGNSACFNGMFVYAPEIYPTNLRTAGIGAGSTAARVGGSISPFISMLAGVVPWAPGVMFGVLCVVTAALNYRFPEPEGHEMPQTIEDIMDWDKTEEKYKKDSDFPKA